MSIAQNTAAIEDLKAQVDALTTIIENPTRSTLDGTEFGILSLPDGTEYKYNIMDVQTGAFLYKDVDHTLTSGELTKILHADGNNLTVTIGLDLGWKKGREVLIVVDGTGFTLDGDVGVTLKSPQTFVDEEFSVFKIIKLDTNVYSAVQLGTSTGGGGGSLVINVQSTTGGADYADGQYTDLSPFALIESDGTVTLPNNAATIYDTQKPSTIPTFYDGTKIVGIDGNFYNITVEFSVRPTSAANDIRVQTSIDIGGAVGEIYYRDFSLTKGNGNEHFYSASFLFYSRDTFEANGGTVKIRTLNGPVEIYNIRYVFALTHNAGDNLTDAITIDEYQAIINSTNASQTNVFVTQDEISNDVSRTGTVIKFDKESVYNKSTPLGNDTITYDFTDAKDLKTAIVHATGTDQLNFPAGTPVKGSHKPSELNRYVALHESANDVVVAIYNDDLETLEAPGLFVVNEDSTSLRFDLTPSQEATGYTIRYDTIDDFDTATDLAGYNGTDLRDSITGLTANTLYYIHAQATAPGKNSSAVTTVSFTPSSDLFHVAEKFINGLGVFENTNDGGDITVSTLSEELIFEDAATASPPSAEEVSTVNNLTVDSSVSDKYFVFDIARGAAVSFVQYQFRDSTGSNLWSIKSQDADSNNQKVTIKESGTNTTANEATGEFNEGTFKAGMVSNEFIVWKWNGTSYDEISRNSMTASYTGHLFIQRSINSIVLQTTRFGNVFMTNFDWVGQYPA